MRPQIVEVGPRDGLQNEPDFVPTVHKVALIERLLDAGVRRIEVASFVHPRLVPQMADAEAVVAALPVRADVSYIGLCLNQRGVARAVATGRCQEIGAVVAASDAFAQRNQGQSSEETVGEAARMLAMADDAGLVGQVTISVAFGCPFAGPTPPERVVRMAAALAAAGATEIALADTIGVAVPAQVTALFAAVRAEIGPAIPLRAHFHDTRNMAIANAWAALGAGVAVLDASVGGLGGCPFAPGASGNVASEDLLYLLRQSGLDVGIDLAAMIETAHWLAGVRGKACHSALSRVGDFERTAV